MDSGGRCRSRKNSRVDSLKVIFTEHRNRTDQPRLTKLGARQEPGLQEVLRCPSFKPVLEISRVPKTMYYRYTKEFCSDSSRSQIFRNIAYANVNIVPAKFLEKKPNGQWVSINAKTDLLRIETQLLSFLGKRPGASVHVYPMPSLFQSLSNVDAPCLDSAPSATWNSQKRYSRAHLTGPGSRLQ